MGQSKKARNVRDSAAKKIGARCHVSAGFARSELMDFLGLLLKSKKLAPAVAAELDLNPDEIALLMVTTPTTKKVQTIFEEAQKIREAELAEEIDLGWQGTAQRSLERATEEKAEPVEKAEAGSEPVNLEDKRLDVKAKPEPSKTKDCKKQRSLLDF
jgi:replication factor C large subunit